MTHTRTYLNINPRLETTKHDSYKCLTSLGLKYLIQKPFKDDFSQYLHLCSNLNMDCKALKALYLILSVKYSTFIVVEYLGHLWNLFVHEMSEFLSRSHNRSLSFKTFYRNCPSQTRSPFCVENQFKLIERSVCSEKYFVLRLPGDLSDAFLIS